MQQKIYNKFDNTLRTIFKLTMKMVQKTAWMTPLMHIIISVGIGGVIGYGSYLIVNGTITSGNFVSFITALVMLYTPIKGIGKNFNNVQISFLAIERVMDILDMDPAVKDRADARVLKQIEKGITFDDVTFEYVPGTPVLKNVNLNVSKTTLVNLLPRFYDVKSGAVKIDGQDIRSLTMESLRDKIAVVFQDNFLFEGTIRDNITLGKENASDEEISAALKMAYLDDFVAGLENGVDTEIGERGALLSGGQRQRLAIARAFIKNAPIVILDEATSAPDNKSEAVVQKAIDNLMQDRTVFVIAHRLSTVQNADKIVVVNDGRIVEEGTHEELLAIDNGAYKALYNAQFKKKAA